MNYFSAVLLVAILVFIHEFGHFIVAKWCGVHVQVLSLGYGRRLFGFQFRGTDYRISLFPLGGYVRMSGADPFGEGYEDDQVLEDPQQAFMRKPVWKRLCIVAAGPAFNLILPVVAFTLLFMGGEPQPVPQLGGVVTNSTAEQAGLRPHDRIVAVDGSPVQTWGQLVELLDNRPDANQLTVVRQTQQFEVEIEGLKPLDLKFLRPAAIIGVDNPKSPAAQAGLKTGDEILEVDGLAIRDFYDLQSAFQTGQSHRLTVNRDGSQLSLTIQNNNGWSPEHAHDSWHGVNQAIGILPATIFVAAVSENLDLDTSAWFVGDSTVAPAYKAGIEPGDRLLTLDNQPIYSWSDVLNAVEGAMIGDGENAQVKPLSLEIVRNGERLTKEISPVIIRDTYVTGEYRYRPLMGILRSGDFVEPPMEPYYYGLSSALTKAVSDTAIISGLIVQQIGKLVTGQAAVEKSIGGPVEIFRQASKAAEEGLFRWFRMMAMLSISLGIVNLLPIPVLDGGQILFYSIEGIRGRPLSLRVRELAQQAGVLFLVFLMLLVMVFDISRLFGAG
ncbi:MAG: RIP metalloprotease RseP [Myxococcota bacterium]